MLFNSLNFAIFLPIVFILYWFFTKNEIKKQNFVLLVASYFFYGCWDYRFLFLLAFSTFLDYFTGIKIFNSSNTRERKIWLFISVFINLGLLGVFKYYNFFVESFGHLLEGFSLQPHFTTLNVILPVGISFYTFHGLSYVFDIYYGKLTPTKNFVDYSLFVSFFPLLVAGPIERAHHFLPQIQSSRQFDYSKAIDGLRQILWGLFKKIVIADTCATHANIIFENYGNYSGSTLVIGAFLFAFQIYCDFSGYSDIALGTARLFGFELLRNFAYPYFSRDIAEFWRRWHISLSSWFRDYLYFPLGGSKVGKWKRIRNTFIIFLVSGFWHGANWTFIVWGLLHAIYFLPLLLLNKNRNNLTIVAQGKLLPGTKDVLNILTTFTITVFAWIFFRSNTLPDAFNYVSRIFSSSMFHSPEIFPKIVFLLIAFFLVIEWIGREHQYSIAHLGLRWPTMVRWGFYCFLIISIISFTGNEQQFIYFQF